MKELRVGRLVDVQPFPEAGAAYKVWIDFGDHGVRRACTGLAHSYSRADLFGRTVVAALNVPPHEVAGFRVDATVLTVEDKNGTAVLIAPDVLVPLGTLVG